MLAYVLIKRFGKQFVQIIYSSTVNSLQATAKNVFILCSF